MVKDVRKNNGNYFICEECQFAYKEKTWAVKCEEYCRKHKSCSLEITKNAIGEVKYTT